MWRCFRNILGVLVVFIGMAHKKTKVFLGYEDELITKKYNALVNYTTNKAGGKPVSKLSCNITKTSLLVLQVSLPLYLWGICSEG